MKKSHILLFLLALFLGSTMHAQRTKAILYFKDGTQITGLGKLKGANKVKFRKTRKDKAKKYDFKNLEKVKIYEADDINTYVYLKVKDKNHYRVLEEVVVGEVMLYKIVSHGQHAGVGMGGFGGAGGGMAIGMGTSFSIKSYYVKQKNEQEVTHLGSTDLFSKSFKKAAGSYFKDCPDLVKKIQNRESKKRDIREVVEYYNTECKK